MSDPVVEQRVSAEQLMELERHLIEKPDDDFDGHRLTTAALVADLCSARAEVERLRSTLRTLALDARDAALSVVSGAEYALRFAPAERMTFAEDLPAGCYPEMTGGLSAVEYLKVIRGETAADGVG